MTDASIRSSAGACPKFEPDDPGIVTAMLRRRKSTLSLTSTTIPHDQRRRGQELNARLPRNGTWRAQAVGRARKPREWSRTAIRIVENTAPDALIDPDVHPVVSEAEAEKSGKPARLRSTTDHVIATSRRQVC